jgi:hypothetical protein
MRNNETSDRIKAGVGRYFAQKCYAIALEIGVDRWGKMRADVMAINTKGEIVIVEVKSSYGDFRSDKKWHHYIDYSNRLYFAVSEDLYAKVHDLIPKGIGIFIVDEAGRARVVQPAKRKELDREIAFGQSIRMNFRHSDFNRYKRKSHAK